MSRSAEKIHITDIEAALNFLRAKYPSPDGVQLQKPCKTRLGALINTPSARKKPSVSDKLRWRRLIRPAKTANSLKKRQRF